MKIYVGAAEHHIMVLSNLFIYATHIIKRMKIYMGLQIHGVNLYLLQLNLNHFSVHPSTQTRKLLHRAIIISEKSYITGASDHVSRQRL